MDKLYLVMAIVQISDIDQAVPKIVGQVKSGQM